jgi:hypothetical protein
MQIQPWRLHAHALVSHHTHARWGMVRVPMKPMPNPSTKQPTAAPRLPSPPPVHRGRFDENKTYIQDTTCTGPLSIRPQGAWGMARVPMKPVLIQSTKQPTAPWLTRPTHANNKMVHLYASRPYNKNNYITRTTAPSKQQQN